VKSSRKSTREEHAMEGRLDEKVKANA